MLFSRPCMCSRLLSRLIVSCELFWGLVDIAVKSQRVLHNTFGPMFSIPECRTFSAVCCQVSPVLPPQNNNNNNNKFPLSCALTLSISSTHMYRRQLSRRHFSMGITFSTPPFLAWTVRKKSCQIHPSVESFSIQIRKMGILVLER